MDESQRAKVEGAQEDTTLEAEWERVAGRPHAEHGATVLYEFENVLATPCGLFKAGGVPCAHGTPPIADLLRAPIDHRSRGFFPLPSFGIPYFGHWLLDGLPTVALAAEVDDLFLPIPANWAHAKAYVQLLDLDPLPDSYVYFDRIFLAADLGKNASLRRRMRQLREELHTRIGGDGGHCVYIRRTGGQHRRLVNEDALCTRLEGNGFTIVADSDPLDRILSVASQASIVVGVEGSQFAHFLLPATEKTVLITINPADRFNNPYADYLGALGGLQGTVVAARVDEGYHVDVDHLMDFIDRLTKDQVSGSKG